MSKFDTKRLGSISDHVLEGEFKYAHCKFQVQSCPESAHSNCVVDKCPITFFSYKMILQASFVTMLPGEKLIYIYMIYIYMFLIRAFRRIRMQRSLCEASRKLVLYSFHTVCPVLSSLSCQTRIPTTLPVGAWMLDLLREASA